MGTEVGDRIGLKFGHTGHRRGIGQNADGPGRKVVSLHTDARNILRNQANSKAISTLH